MIAGKAERDKKFISVYHAHVDEIYQFIYLRTGSDKMIAEDLTQEIFVEVYKGLSGFKGLSSERTWIFRIAKNRLNDFYRKQYRSMFANISIEELHSEQLEEIEPDIGENLIRDFEKECVLSCLAALPKQYKIVLTMKYMDELSTKEIARIVGKSPKAIESLLRRAKNAFIKRYIEMEEKEES